MSDGERIAWVKGMILAEGVAKWIADCCDKVEIAGSIRREKETVGDIEIVCQPHNPLALANTLDTLVHEGTIVKALYRTKTGMSPRWGDRLKCFVLAGVNVELAIGDADNFGYLYWLRTGPSDGNTFVMTKMKQEKSAMRFDSGYAWLVDYVGEQPTYSHKLSLPTEQFVFRTLGMDYINPLWRGEKIYAAEWKGVMPKYLLDEYRVREPKQKRLF